MVPTDKKQQAPAGLETHSKGSTRQQQQGGASPKGGGDGVQGEGNYEAARHFNDAERKFVESGKVDAAARAAAPKSEAERQAMLAAEAEGKRRAKEEDPALTKPRPGSAKGTQ